MTIHNDDTGFTVFSPKGFFLVIVISLLVVGIGAGITMAKTGLVTVPILSNVFYNKTQPTRVVVPGHVTQKEIDELLLAKLLSVAEVANEVPALPESIQFTEEEATIIVRSQLDLLDVGSLKVDGAQLVFLDGIVEFFAEVSNGERETTLKLVVAPTFIDGSIDISIKRVEVGNVRIPSFLPNVLLGTLLSARLRELEASLLGTPLTTVTVRDGFIEIELDPGKFE